MLVQIGNTVLSIFWRHHNINPKTGKEYSKRYTKCIIRLGLGVDSVTLADTTSNCHKGDIYEKCFGRKLTLKRAIEFIVNSTETSQLLTKEIRKSIWVKYAETTKCNFVVGDKKVKRSIQKLSLSDGPMIPVTQI